jgi:UDP-N-acetylmuramate dehydrogenase
VDRRRVVTLDAVVADIETRLPGSVERDAPSGPLTTYRCGGHLAALVRIRREQDVETLGSVLAAHPDAPVLVVGRGSNLLVADAGFAGIGVALGGDLERVEIDAAEARVVAGGAVALPVMARQAAPAGIGGLEFFVGIPGSVGGAVRMNAGGHGAETRDVLISARVADLGQGDLLDLDVDALQLGYRRSALTARMLVVRAVFAGRSDDPAECARRIEEIVRWRREHQPGGQNAGSVFTNPPGDSAGRLIDATGCKGLRVGGVVVSEKHANFFVAEPGAKAGDVVALIAQVRARVEAATGVHLEPELQLVGFAGGCKEAS